MDSSVLAAFCLLLPEDCKLSRMLLTRRGRSRYASGPHTKSTLSSARSFSFNLSFKKRDSELTAMIRRGS